MSILRDFFGTLKNAGSNVRKFMFCVFLNGVIMSALNVMLGIHYKNIGLTEDVIGTLMALKTFGSAIGALSAVVIIESLGTRKALTASFITMALTGFCYVNITSSMLIMQATSLIFGIAQVVFTVSQAPFYKNNSDDKTAVGIFSLNFVITNLAMFSGSYVFGYLSDGFALMGGDVFGSQMALNIGFAALLVAPLAINRIDFGKEHIRKKDEKKLRLKDYANAMTKDAWMYMMKKALIGMGAGLVIPYFSVYIKYSLNVSDSVVGSIIAFSQFGTVLGGLLIPSLSKRFGRVKMAVFCQLISIPFLYSISYTQGIMMMAISFFCRNTFMNMTSPLLQTMEMDLVAPENRTIMSSMATLADSLFRALGTQLGGILMVKISYEFPYYLTILTYLLSTVVIYVVFGRNKKYSELH
ncbi:MAG: MFS transporter [Clostridia bacterium]|nr:MFS transporter [Clostridia bacterium]MBR5266233.1 MFS transporter [Clostridia bacterium]